MKISYKKILILCFTIIFMFSLFFIGKSFAANKVFKLVDAKVEEKSETVDSKVTLDGDNVKTDLTFHKVDDYIVYKFSFKNNDNVDYIIKSISDDNKNIYVTYSYDQHKDEKVKAGETKEILVKVTYSNEVKEASERDINEKVTFSFEIEDEKGNKVIDNIPVNPKTGDYIVSYISIAIISLSGIVFIVIKNKKIKKTMIAIVLLTPFITRALEVSFSITFINEVKLRDKELVTIDVYGKKTETLIPYDTKIEKPEDPTKEGYEFIGWYSKDKEYDFTKTVKDDLEIKAKYNLIEYTINYNLDNGLAVNRIKYNVETDSFTLNNPIKPGYSFSGWTGSNGESLQTRVTVEKGTTGDLTFSANFSTNEDTPYKVFHKYKNLNGDGYSEEITEDLVGTTDSTVKPATLTKTGFENPELEDLVITGDGEATLEYIYERKEFTLSYTDDVIASKPQGTYKYGTPVTISAKEKTGYAFNKWNVNTNNSAIFVDADENNIITLGDIVIIGTDWFHVIDSPENGEVKLLPLHNININGRQSILFEGNQVKFSNNNYWYNSDAYAPFSDNFSLYIYRTIENRSSTLGDTNNNIKSRVNSYKDYLNSLNIINVIDARLMSVEEARVTGCNASSSKSCPEWVANESYWLGSSVGKSSDVWHVSGPSERKLINSRMYNSPLTIRPIITVAESDLFINEDLNSQSTIIIEEDTDIVPSYKPKADTTYQVVHRKQNQDNEDVYDIEEIEYKTGYAGQVVVPLHKTYTDYHPLSLKTEIRIDADGSTVIDLLYDYLYYNVSYDANGGSVITESQKIRKGNTTYTPTPKRNKHIFTGWYTEADGGTLVADINSSFTPTKSITLYAHWEEFDTTPTLVDENQDLEISLGDRVVIGNDEFYYIGKDGNGDLKLLSKYSLDYEYRQSAEDAAYVPFSSINYWANSSTSSSSSSSSSSPNYSFNADEYNYKYIYRDSLDKDINENNLTSYINNYKSYLKNDLDVNVKDARLMSYEEALFIGCDSYNIYSCPEWAANQQYWLGSAYNNYGSVWVVADYYRYLNYNGYDAFDIYGVRPVIIISENDLKLPWSNNETLLYGDADKSGGVTTGDTVRIVSEEFRVVDVPSDGKVRLLASYNVNSDSLLQSEEYENTTYSDSCYWDDSSSYAPFGDSTYKYVYRQSSNIDNTNGDTNNKLKNTINGYKDYLNSLSLINILDARLMSYEEALIFGCLYESNDSCPPYVSNQTYWLGTEVHNFQGVFNVVSDQNHLAPRMYNLKQVWNAHVGIRPLIVISESDLNQFIN